MDRSWILNRDRLCLEYRNGVQSFIDIARHHMNDRNEILCPCKTCINKSFHSINVVQVHLLTYGMVVTYDNWIYHGDHTHQKEIRGGASTTVSQQNNLSDMFDMIDDAFPRIENYDQGTMIDDERSNEEYEMRGSDTSNLDMEDVDNYEKLLCEAQRKLYPGCSDYSVLTYVVELIHNKVDNHMTNKAIDKMLEMMKKMCPKPNDVPQTYNECKKILRVLGLCYENIHACYYDCVLFYKEHENKDRCPVCNEPRYQESDREQKKKICRKVLRYVPLKPRLQRLFMSRHTAEDMRRHHEKRVDEKDMMRHPADSFAWKEFDEMYPTFAADPRNVRLGLATDGFNPFGNMSTSYSMWPVILLPYNLPPWKCMKKPYSMLTLLIPGPKSPGKELDVYLRPLVDELKELWGNGVWTYDKMSNTTFIMRAALLWTINDFPAYGSLSGWSTHGKLACPVCNKDASYTKLISKYCYIGHRRYLPMDHSWRKNTKDFNGCREMRHPPREFSGEDILEQFDYLVPDMPGKHPDNKNRKRKRNTEELNWRKKSILFELEYWSKLKIRHNLDVLHIEKNIFDSVMGTLLNTVKSKDTLKARMNLQAMKIRKNLHLKSNGNKLEKPQAEYVLLPSNRRLFLQWLKSVKFPDGYAANISRNVNVDDGKIVGLKSHDCHILMQRVLPVGIRKYLKKQICGPLVELSCFFQQICAKTLNVSDLDKLEENIVLILCKLEKIFPPAFFDSMVHLAVHLPREAKLAGPVRYRWMYPIERLLGTYKKYVRIKARPESSIAEAYIEYESLTFCSMYLSGVETEHTRPERNNDGSDPIANLFVFAQNARPFGGHAMIEMSKDELEASFWYILDNCDEIESFRNEHIDMLQRDGLENVTQRHKTLFPEWFKRRATDLFYQEPKMVSEEIYSLAQGPDQRVVQYTGCVVNGIRYLIKRLDQFRTTHNSGVMTPGSHDGVPCDFYGSLVNVIKLQFTRGFKAILFKCDWYNTNPNGKKVIQDYHLTSVNLNSRWYTSDPYVLATQAHQVFYISDPKLGNPWYVVQKSLHRHVLDVPEKDDDADATDDIESDDDNDNIIRPIQDDDDDDEDDLPLSNGNHDQVENMLVVDDDFSGESSMDEDANSDNEDVSGNEDVESDTYSDVD